MYSEYPYLSYGNPPIFMDRATECANLFARSRMISCSMIDLEKKSIYGVVSTACKAASSQ